MPTSVPMMPDAGALQGTDWLYLIQGMNLDRDKKVSLATVREFMSERGADTLVANAPDTGDWEINVTNPRSLFVYIQGVGTGKITITGAVPPGHSVVLWNIMATATVEMEADNADGNCFPAIGTVDRLGTVVLNRMGPYDWGCAHTMDRNTLNTYFTQMGRAIEDTASSLGSAISSESTSRAEADNALGVRIDAATADLRTVPLDSVSVIDVSGDSDQILVLAGGAGGPYPITGALAVGKRATIHNATGANVQITYPLDSYSVTLGNGESLEFLVTHLLNVGYPEQMEGIFTEYRRGGVVERATCALSTLSSVGYKALAQVARTTGEYIVGGWVEVEVFTLAGSITEAVATLRDSGITAQGRTFPLLPSWKIPTGQKQRLFLTIPPTYWKITAASGDYCELDVQLSGGGVVDMVKAELFAQRISPRGPFA